LPGASSTTRSTRWYGIDYEAVRALSLPALDALCVERAGGLPHGCSVGANRR
jgi:hypothetical protein